MKNVNMLFSLLLLSAMSASCVNLDGRLDVKQTMTAKRKSGFLHLKTKDVVIQPDLYAAELKINGDKSFTLKLEGHNKILLPIKSKNDFNVPANGTITISHNDINQPFDLTGRIETDITNSDSRREIEDCTWTVKENHCKKVCTKEDTCHAECADVEITMHGQRVVEFHYRTTHRDLGMDLLQVGSREVLASFHGTNDDVDQINDYIGACRR
jgi:hypothetical protein